MPPRVARFSKKAFGDVTFGSTPIIQRGTSLFDEEASGFVRRGKRICDACCSGRQLDFHPRSIPMESAWDGLDVFTPPRLPGTIVVTERIVGAVVREGLTNFRFEKAEEHRCPYDARKPGPSR